MSIKHLYLFALAAMVACATTGAGGGGQSSKVLTFEDMARAHADENSAYDAVARLRPNWLAGHGITSSGGSTQYATVYVDGQRYGEISSLRQIQAFHVVTMRYYDITEAGARFGIGGGSSGVIEITTR
jgi:hypothetical protein